MLGIRDDGSWVPRSVANWVPSSETSWLSRSEPAVVPMLASRVLRSADNPVGSVASPAVAAALIAEHRRQRRRVSREGEVGRQVLRSVNSVGSVGSVRLSWNSCQEVVAHEPGSCSRRITDSRSSGRVGLVRLLGSVRYVR